MCLAVYVLVEDGNTGEQSCKSESVLAKREGLWWTSGRSVPSLLAQHWGLWCRCREQDGAIPGMFPRADVLPAYAEGCPPARRELSSSSPGGEPTWGC